MTSTIIDSSILNKINIGEGIAGLRLLPDNSVDLILTDLPYGTTQCAWDSIIPLDTMWYEFMRVIKPNSAIVLTAAQPFTSKLVMSNPTNFKYSMVWEKSKATGYLMAKKRPLMAHEDILVFGKKGGIKYNPQMKEGTPYNKGTALRLTGVYGNQKVTTVKNDSGQRYPRSVVYYKTAESEGKVIHSTQKPISLFKYLISTYSNEGDLVVDICGGSGTTAISAHALNRNYILWELDKEIANKAIDRFEKYFQNNPK